MFSITCPHCGKRDGSEFTYVGDAQALRQRPALDADVATLNRYVYDRSNPRGAHWELWQHTGGCRAFVEVQRDTLTHRVLDHRAPSNVSGDLAGEEGEAP